MFALDPRLFPLLEVLAGSGLDWLASEVVTGALAGRVSDEPGELLLLAREAATRVNQHELKARDLAPLEVLPEPFTGAEHRFR